jgi:hypothetical protein
MENVLNDTALSKRRGWALEVTKLLSNKKVSGLHNKG